MPPPSEHSVRFGAEPRNPPSPLPLHFVDSAVCVTCALADDEKADLVSSVIVTVSRGMDAAPDRYVLEPVPPLLGDAIYRRLVALRDDGDPGAATDAARRIQDCVRRYNYRVGEHEMVRFAIPTALSREYFGGAYKMEELPPSYDEAIFDVALRRTKVTNGEIRLTFVEFQRGLPVEMGLFQPDPYVEVFIPDGRKGYVPHVVALPDGDSTTGTIRNLAAEFCIEGPERVLEKLIPSEAPEDKDEIAADLGQVEDDDPVTSKEDKAAELLREYFPDGYSDAEVIETPQGYRAWARNGDTVLFVVAPTDLDAGEALIFRSTTKDAIEARIESLLRDIERMTSHFEDEPKRRVAFESIESRTDFMHHRPGIVRNCYIEEVVRNAQLRRLEVKGGSILDVARAELLVGMEHVRVSLNPTLPYRFESMDFVLNASGEGYLEARNDFGDLARVPLALPPTDEMEDVAEEIERLIGLAVKQPDVFLAGTVRAANKNGSTNVAILDSGRINLLVEATPYRSALAKIRYVEVAPPSFIAVEDEGSIAEALVIEAGRNHDQMRIVLAPAGIRELTVRSPNAAAKGVIETYIYRPKACDEGGVLDAELLSKHFGSFHEQRGPCIPPSREPFVDTDLAKYLDSIFGAPSERRAFH